MHGFKSAILAIFQKSADWLDWPCPVSAALQNGSQDFFFSFIFKYFFIFLKMKPLSEAVPGLFSFRSRSKQCDVKAGLVNSWFHFFYVTDRLNVGHIWFWKRLQCELGRLQLDMLITLRSRISVESK